MIDKRYVMDASALLAVIHKETGADKVKPLLEESVVSSVNWSEVLQKLKRVELNAARIGQLLQSLGLEVVPFSEQQAELAATLWQQAAPMGLSLADRACVATGEALGMEIVTADKVWKDLNLSVPVFSIR
ncbi:type II toxin-antitoxin system VapC family toxin [Thiothrix lacustris]|uniref:type II toxin-antitoxin system VapC family toxin n=1 Tax=Thiothrix lacustris TaxID=525917 RepID=UPI0027E3DBC4|nr:type II toxin-antitoxin system VapC family toxin [Thiothrix lacustris]WMP18092.1 type II toxin-antitoxin system VapC family toxin [Thiothrix lacustris]